MVEAEVVWERIIGGIWALVIMFGSMNIYMDAMRQAWFAFFADAFILCLGWFMITYNRHQAIQKAKESVRA